MKMTLPIVVVLVLCLCTSIRAQHLVSALINACGSEGENEYFVLKNDLDSSLLVDGDVISLRYGSNPIELETFTDSYVPTGNSLFVDSLNSRLSGCDFEFINAQANDTIHADQYFMIFYQQPSVLPDFSHWCGKSMGDILVLFSNDPSWRPDGNFNSHPPDTRYFKLALNKHWKMYSYDSLFTSGQDGDYLIWGSQGGLPVDFGNDNSCTPDLQAGFLPIEWISLDSYYDQNMNGVYLEGHIISTTQIEKITILKSSNGSSFKELHQFTAIEGSTYHLEYLDKDLSMTNYYYQLEVSSIDDHAHSTIQSVRIPSPTFSVYPNPARNWLHHTASKSNSYEIIAQNGQVVESTKSNSAAISVEHLRPGMYYLRILTPQESFTQLFFKN